MTNIRPSSEPRQIDYGVCIDLVQDDLLTLKNRHDPYTWIFELLHRWNPILKLVTMTDIVGRRLKLYTKDEADSVKIKDYLQTEDLCFLGFIHKDTKVTSLIQGEYWFKITSYELGNTPGQCKTRLEIGSEAQKHLRELLGKDVVQVLWYAPNRIVFQVRSYGDIEALYRLTSGFTKKIAVGARGKYQ